MDQSGPSFPKNAAIKKTNDKILSQTEFTMSRRLAAHNNIAPKLQKCWTQKIAFKIIPKMLKQPNFFYGQPSALPKETLSKFYLSTTVAV